LYTFFLAMALNPCTMKKAQEELDKVVGNDRLPDFSDQVDLPYTSAIVKEVLRWGGLAPIGVPRRVIKDDIYNGYFIPAGATIIENTW
jgi:cytochrome P450